ncbi:MAG: iron chelate uptake ABC transporter family permease subunit, partial [Bacteroidales bacterium]|nr:iron chelate uptake ABC transporter family permease subunit [Bacteroidales bacterium]
GVGLFICGSLGFVVFVSAHLVRCFLSICLHSIVVPMAALIGGCFAVGADFLSVVFGTPLPSGSMMAILGAPIIVYILLSKRS